ncbi:MFS transporter [Helicobacter monodelphidis]|uniref:peptide MFS transporter n=1 Tax=Helicobacter sp. 15-1451 TaxID=2004995 RepID=UPI000DCD553C|nr:peptide MFS transporter [Helicobacter sp. 15-1451]RAX56805.1 MFS transporter [Helicobacter sp. 15-1451]
MSKNTDINTSFMGHPKPLFSLSMTEVWERFSFYGIRPLLVLFMAAAVSSGGLGMSKEDSAAIVGIFGGFLYLATLPGGWLADNWLGQKKAVFIGAIIIAFGHLSIGLSMFSEIMFFLGLALIVIGTGLFKTCSSVMVGMLYKQDDARRDSGFTIFYMGINIGAFIAPLITGIVQKEYGWHLGFGIGGLGMLLCLAIFYFKTIKDFEEFRDKVGLEQDYDKPMVENKNVLKVIMCSVIAILAFIVFIVVLGHYGVIDLSPASLAKKMVFVIAICTTIYFLYLYFFSHLNRDEKKNLIVFVILFFAAAFFWSTFEQKPTSFNLFAQDFTDRVIFGWEIPVVWFSSLNPLFIIIFAPIISMIWILLLKKNIELSSMSKFGLGVFGAGVGFGIMFLASKVVLASDGGLVSPLYLIIALLCLTLGELCLSPVGLSIMTKIAPNVIKNQVMGLWFVASSLGNIIAGLIGGGVSADNIEHLPNLFGQCMWALFGTAIVLFFLRKPIYKMLAH